MRTFNLKEEIKLLERIRALKFELQYEYQRESDPPEFRRRNGKKVCLRIIKKIMKLQEKIGDLEPKLFPDESAGESFYDVPNE